jgi:hypothetical protein
VCDNSAVPFYKAIMSERFKSITGEGYNAGNRSYRHVIRDLSPAPAKQCSRSRLSKSTSVQEICEFLGCPALLCEGLNGVGGHHQVFIITPSDSIAILRNGSSQKEAFISEASIYFVAENSGAHVNPIIATGPRPLGPFYPKRKVGKRSNVRHPGKRNPAINDVILAH